MEGKGEIRSEGVRGRDGLRTSTRSFQALAGFLRARKNLQRHNFGRDIVLCNPLGLTSRFKLMLTKDRGSEGTLKTDTKLGHPIKADNLKL